MRNILCIILLFAVTRNLTLGQGYYSDRMYDASGSFRKTAHTHSSGLTRSEYAQIDEMIDVVVDQVKSVYPGPIGVDVGPYGGSLTSYPFGVSETEGGPYRIYVTIAFYDLYKTRTGSIEASGEYSSNIEVWINSIGYLLQGNSVQYTNKIYRAPFPGIPVNGYPKYNNLLLILPPGKSLPWRPATKQEYLENVIAKEKAQNSNAAQRNSIQWVEQILQSMSPSERNEIAYLKKAKNSFSDYVISKQWLGFANASDK